MYSPKRRVADMPPLSWADGWYDAVRMDADLNDDAFLPHHYCDEAEVYSLLSSFEDVKVWADLAAPAAEGELPRRGYWVASARKPTR